MSSRIISIEYCYPENKISNNILKEKFSDYDFEKFENKIGIKNRYHVDEHTTALDLAINACNKMFKKIDKNSIDFILYCTQSPDYILPSSSCILQERLSIKKNIGAIDFNLGCSGYTYGILLAKSLIESSSATNVLLITADSYSKYIHPLDKSNLAIFGDAATATLISKSEYNYIEKFICGTDGGGANDLIIKNGGCRNLLDTKPKEKIYGSNNVYTDNHLYMNGPEIYNFTNKIIPSFLIDILDANELNIDQVDQFILHQANAFLLKQIRKKLDIHNDKFYINLEDGGNTVSSTIPIALKNYSKNCITQQKIILLGFGVGLSWSGGLILIDSNL